MISFFLVITSPEPPCRAFYTDNMTQEEGLNRGQVSKENLQQLGSLGKQIQPTSPQRGEQQIYLEMQDQVGNNPVMQELFGANTELTPAFRQAIEHPERPPVVSAQELDPAWRGTPEQRQNRAAYAQKIQEQNRLWQGFTVGKPSFNDLLRLGYQPDGDHPHRLSGGVQGDGPPVGDPFQPNIATPLSHILNRVNRMQAGDSLSSEAAEQDATRLVNQAQQTTQRVRNEQNATWQTPLMPSTHPQTPPNGSQLNTSA
jgi:hypothetical protein